MTTLKPSELVLNDGKVYHLDLRPDQISETIILVGDQYRVPMVSAFFDSIEHQVQKREFLCHTGLYGGKRLSVVSTGIGTDNIDIVLNELDALVNIDLEARQEKAKKTKLTFVRIGTCGALQEDIPVGSFILSTGSFGLDNVSNFYEIPRSEKEQEILAGFMNHVNFPSTIAPYFTFADEALNLKLAQHIDVHQGFTVTSTGFYGPQGRKLRLPLQIPDLNDAFSSFDFAGAKIANFEMESSAIFALSRGLGHDAACVCVALANRKRGEFLEDYHPKMMALIEHVLQTIIS